MLLSVLLSASCAAGPPGGASPATLVYVLSARDATVTRLDGATGQAVGPRLPAGDAPWALAAAGDAAVVVQPASWRDDGRLTRVARTAGGWDVRTLLVDPAGRSLALAGDGERFAVLAYAARVAAPGAMTPPCRLALVDIRAGTIGRTPPVCSAGDLVLGLALAPTAAGPTAAGPTAFLTLWRPAAAPGAGSGGGHILAADTATGAVLASYALAGSPGDTAIGPGPGGTGQRLYVVEGLSGASTDPERAPDDVPADHWRVLVLRLPALELERAYPAPAPARRLAVAPDGRHVYAFVSRGHQTLPSVIAALDLGTGSWRPLATVPGAGAGGLVVAGDRLYAPHVEGDRVTAVDRRSGAWLGTLAVGRAPVALAVGTTAP